jgi:hypothetical protein
MKARTICCNRLIEVEKGKIAKTKFGELLVCSENCRKFIENATSRQIKNLML